MRTDWTSRTSQNGYQNKHITHYYFISQLNKSWQMLTIVSKLLTFTNKNKEKGMRFQQHDTNPFCLCMLYFPFHERQIFSEDKREVQHHVLVLCSLWPYNEDMNIHHNKISSSKERVKRCILDRREWWSCDGCGSLQRHCICSCLFSGEISIQQYKV